MISPSNKGDSRYGLIAASFSLVIIAVVTTLGTNLNTAFTKVAAALTH